jgi:hypothetical protein
MIFPEFSLKMVNMELNDYITVRLFGMVLLYTLAIYYVVLSKRKESLAFFSAYPSIPGSSALILVIVFVLVGWAKATDHWFCYS